MTVQQVVSELVMGGGAVRPRGSTGRLPAERLHDGGVLVENLARTRTGPGCLAYTLRSPSSVSNQGHGNEPAFPCSTQHRRIDIVGDTSDAVSLGDQGGGASGDQDASRGGDDLDRLAVRTLEEMDLAHGLSGRHLRAEVDQVLVDPALGGEAVILTIERLDPAGRRQA